MIKRMWQIMAAVALGLFLSLNRTIAHADPSTSPLPSSDPQPLSYTITVTARIPLSDLWEKTIKNNSTVFQEDKNNFGVTIGSLNGFILKNEPVKAYVYKDNQLVDTLETKTDETGRALYTYNPQENGNYEIKFAYVSWDKEAVLNKSLSITF